MLKKASPIISCYHTWLLCQHSGSLDVGQRLKGIIASSTPSSLPADKWRQWNDVHHPSKNISGICRLSTPHTSSGSGFSFFLGKPNALSDGIWNLCLKLTWMWVFSWESKSSHSDWKLHDVLCSLWFVGTGVLYFVTCCKFGWKSLLKIFVFFYGTKICYEDKL